jgi:hypothetical protein
MLARFSLHLVLGPDRWTESEFRADQGSNAGLRLQARK